MNRLFLDLFAYRQRENKDPLEDWLTECLAATMRAFPGGKLAELLCWLSNATNEARILPHVESGKVAIETQYAAATAGRPDMVVTIGGVPWIVFENKVGHHVSGRVSEDGGKSHQLRGYADWLKVASEGCDLRPGMVFVTHLTPPPEDFEDGYPVDHYHGFSRCRLSWGEFAKKLLELASELPTDHHASALAEALQAYLKENNMSSEFPDMTAFAAAQIYLAQAKRLEGLVDRMWTHARRVAGFGKTADYVLKPQTEYGTIAAWRYIAPTTKSQSRDSYIETGVWFSEMGDWAEELALLGNFRGPQVYIGLFNGTDDYFSFVPGAPEGFFRANGDFVAMKAIADFAQEPQTRGQEIEAWTAERAKILRAFLQEQDLAKP
ncbi:MAG: hypothetical protein V2I43_10020 [Parvularcula sp.]|nr:hypothetical protein [Parvularcula sp.]